MNIAGTGITANSKIGTKKRLPVFASMEEKIKSPDPKILPQIKLPGARSSHCGPSESTWRELLLGEGGDKEGSWVHVKHRLNETMFHMYSSPSGVHRPPNVEGEKVWRSLAHLLYNGNGEKYIYHFVHIYVQKCRSIHIYVLTFQFSLFEGILWGYNYIEHT